MRRLIMRVTIKEVAKEAGVSLSTVSRVLHNNPKISEKTKETVNKAIKKLGYYPNVIASSLAGKPTKTIGIVIPNDSEELFKNTFFINAMRGISIYAQKKGYFLMYSFSKDGEEEVRFIEKYIQSGWVSGVVLLNAAKNDKCVFYLQEKNFPFVVIGSLPNNQGVNWVDNDNISAMYNVVNRVVEEGFPRVAFIGGPRSLRVTEDRLLGYKKALSANGLEYDEAKVFFCDSFSEASGSRAINNLLNNNDIDSVVTTDDLLAFGVITQLGLLDLNMPVTGFNNSLRSEYSVPSLTTVEINADELGASAAKILISHLENRSLPKEGFVVDTSLIERDSTLNFM